jgi:hypothetical protein
MALKALIPPNQEHTLCHSSPTLPESIVRRNRGHTVCLLADRRFKYNNVIKSGFGSCSRPTTPYNLSQLQDCGHSECTHIRVLCM